MRCGDCTLKETFPELYCLSRTKDSSVAEVMCWASGRIYWNFHFRHPLQDGEEESFDRFMDTFILQKCGGLVLIRFVGSQQGVEVLRLEIFIFFSTLILSFPWRLAWQSKVPQRVAFFSCLASLDKILTTDNLFKRRIIVLGWRYMCKRCGEVLDHLLLHCPVAFELWSLVFCLFGLHWVMPHKVIQLFESRQGKFGQHRNIDFWRLMPHCLM